MKRGFLISFDGILSISVAFVFFLTAIFYLSGVESSSRQSSYLKDFSMDIASVLEKSGDLESAIDNNSVGPIESFLNRTPKNVCTQLRLFDKDDTSNSVMIVRKNGCLDDYTERTALKRSFFVESKDEFYLAEVNSWFKVAE